MGFQSTWRQSLIDPPLIQRQPNDGLTKVIHRLVRLLAWPLSASEGRILFEGEVLAATPARTFAVHPRRAVVQVVFQDPTDSLNPRFSARYHLRALCTALAGVGRVAADERVDEVAQQVGLAPELLSRFSHQLLVGQKARVGIARALVLAIPGQGPRIRLEGGL